VTLEIESGKCRVCGCSELNPCLTYDRPGHPLIPCAWVDPRRTLCSSLLCIASVPLAELLDICMPAEAA
jgi:hypothetical protein